MKRVGWIWLRVCLSMASVKHKKECSQKKELFMEGAGLIGMFISTGKCDYTMIPKWTIFVSILMEESQFQSARGLKQFVLKNVTRSTKEPQKPGTGSYGSVEKLEDSGIICAGKTLHNSLINVQNEGVENVIRKFVKECQLMGDLRHPHIVQFLCICFLPDSKLPVLVMEYMATNLGPCLRRMKMYPSL